MDRNAIVTEIIPSPRKPYSIYSLLYPIFANLVALETQGVKYRIDSEDNILKASLRIYIGDMPVCNDLLDRIKHTGYYGCRICTIKTTKDSRSKYFSSENLQNLQIRSKQDILRPEKVHSDRVIEGHHRYEFFFIFI